jgi:hypothetical protein
MGSTAWESAITSILSSGGTNSIYILQNIVPLIDYVNTIRPIPAPLEMCQTTSIWCTHSYEEKEKCDVLKTVALTLGIVLSRAFWVKLILIKKPLSLLNFRNLSNN